MQRIYSAWIHQYQVFNERENLTLPGFIGEVSDITYYHHEDAKRYWRSVQPNAGGNSINLNQYIIPPLLIVDINCLGVTGFTPGLNRIKRRYNILFTKIH